MDIFVFKDGSRMYETGISFDEIKSVVDSTFTEVSQLFCLALLYTVINKRRNTNRLMISGKKPLSIKCFFSKKSILIYICVPRFYTFYYSEKQI